MTYQNLDDTTGNASPRGVFLLLTAEQLHSEENGVGTRDMVRVVLTRAVMADSLEVTE